MLHHTLIAAGIIAAIVACVVIGFVAGFAACAACNPAGGDNSDKPHPSHGFGDTL